MNINIALFIDGDNVSKTNFQTNFNQIKLRGTICIKRIYFDFTDKMDKKWKSIILDNGIESISVLNLPGKNSTDIKLMLDIIKEFYLNPIINTYIIMSSDSDFYHIATFLRSNGKRVICYGELHTPLMLKNVCDEFVLCIKKSEQQNNSTLLHQKKQLNDANSDNSDNSDNDDINKSNSDKNKSTIDNNKSNIDNNKSTIDNNKSNINNNKREDKRERELYEELINIDPFYFDKSKSIHNKWTKYKYYKEYNNKIYILRDFINSINLIYKNKNLENKPLSLLKDLLIRFDSSFSEKNFGFNSFNKFINSLFLDEIITEVSSNKKTIMITKINFNYFN